MPTSPKQANACPYQSMPMARDMPVFESSRNLAQSSNQQGSFHVIWLFEPKGDIRIAIAVPASRPSWRCIAQVEKRLPEPIPRPK